uniref:Glutathione S-transferase kappa n=1 Tax=Eptatretus burgeri TaxID=7764 RepID=A0A8C4WYL2_EPTBU
MTKILCRYKPVWNVQIQFRPAFLGGIMKATGNSPPAVIPKKGIYLQSDIVRLGKFCKLPLHLPADFFDVIITKGSLSAQRFLTALEIVHEKNGGIGNSPLLESLSRQFWIRIWSRDEDITKLDSLTAAAKEAGLTPALIEQLMTLHETSEVKERLKKVTNDAIENGAFGMPWLVVHLPGSPSFSLFGSDRMELLADLLGEKWYGPVPPLPKM